MPTDFFLPALPALTSQQWLIAGIAAFGMGISKSGWPGISLLHVVLFAQLFPGLASTGVVLPMLICGDFGAVLLFRRHAQWHHVFCTLPPAILGVGCGWWIMSRLSLFDFRPMIGAIVLTLAVLQLARHRFPELLAQVPHSRPFAWGIGLLAGMTTMLANAAGPVMALYLLAVSLPKSEFIGTGAWFFLLVNVFKVPFSSQLGLITTSTLAFNASLLPLIAAGLFAGKYLVSHLPQKGFDMLILIFAVLAAIKLLGWVG